MLRRLTVAVQVALCVLALSAPVPARAAAVPYVLDAARSSVDFSWTLGKQEMHGVIPILRADLVIDFARLAASRVDVVMDAGAAEAGVPFATDAMRGPDILDAKAHPQIRFTSRRVVPNGATSATVEGDLTIRGVTRPATFRAEIYRQQGSDAGDLSRLTVLLTGSVLRSDYGATGFADLAGDRVQFRVLARISAQE